VHSLAINILPRLQPGDGTQQIIQLAAATRPEVLGLSIVQPITDSTPIVDGKDDVTFGSQVLILGVHPVIGVHGMEAQHHLPPRAAVNEQHRWIWFPGS
jgi:hypothetical protein